MELTLNQYRFLRQLADAGGEAGPTKPATSPADRKTVIDAGLVATRKEGRSTLFSTTDQGKAWLAEHPAPPAKAPPKPRERTSVTPKVELPPGFPKPQQRAFLIKLAFMQPGQSAAAPKDREPLQKWFTSRKQGRGFAHELTDAGWAWVEEHLSTPLVGGLALEALGAVLVRLDAYRKAHDLRLADLVTAEPAAATSAAATSAADVTAAIRQAALRLGDGQTHRRIRLADLRAALPDWPRPAVDQALTDLSMSDPPAISLMPIDDPQDMGPADHAAVYHTRSGETRHQLYWVGA